MLALILWLFVMLTLLSADAGLLVDLSSRLKASYGFDFPGGGMGSLKLSIIGEALRDSGDGSAIALLKNPVPTATKSGGGANNSSKPTQDLERSNTNTPGSPTATGSSSSSLTPSPTPTRNRARDDAQPNAGQHNRWRNSRDKFPDSQSGHQLGTYMDTFNYAKPNNPHGDTNAQAPHGYGYKNADQNIDTHKDARAEPHLYADADLHH